MSSIVQRSSVEVLPRNYLNEENTLWSWLLTTDHKRIALLYFASITASSSSAARRRR